MNKLLVAIIVFLSGLSLILSAPSGPSRVNSNHLETGKKAGVNRPGLKLDVNFGNMPLYRRYYVADLPGFGWTGNFFANLYVHYISGALVLALGLYFLFSYGLIRGKGRRLTVSGVVRAVILALALVSGLFMALKNFPQFNFSFEAAMVLTLLHLAAAMLFLILALFCFIGRRKWLRAVGMFRS